MHLLVGNPTAQSGKNAERIDAARMLLERHGVRHDFLSTRAGGKTVGDVSKALSGGAYAGVIAMGGDGTFAEVGRGLLSSGVRVPMGVLPTGTANDQGRSFGMYAPARYLEDNVRTIAAGHTVPLDAGRVTAYDFLDVELASDWFFDSLGWGISPKILRMRNEDRRLVAGIPIVRELYRDQLVYAGAVLRALLQSYVEVTKFEVEVTTPAGTTFLDGLTDLVLKNTRVYAGSWVLDPTSSPEDGEMELVPFRGRDEWIGRAVVTLEGLPVQQLDPGLPPLTPIIRAPWFRLKVMDRPGGVVEAQIDGEEWVAAASWSIQVVRHAIDLVVPRSHGHGAQAHETPDAGTGTSGQGTPGQGASGQGASGQGTSGQGPSA
ncbi:MAG: diacylglycerol kinase family protein [Pseudomonadota bacterium]|nr:diacylglycerol kinase family protein [Pseudomonadota bacterium]